MGRALLFRGGTVFDGHRYRGRADVLVDAGRVVAVGSDLRGDEVVDAAFVSRADLVEFVGPPGPDACRTILTAGVKALAAAFPKVEGVLGDRAYRRLADFYRRLRGRPKIWTA